MNETPKITPYVAAKIANEVLAENEIAVTIKPQMMYNYVSKNYIESYKIDDKIYVDNESFATWLRKYVEKKKNSANSSTSVAELRAALNV